MGDVVYGGYTLPNLKKESFYYSVGRDSWTFSINFVLQANGGVGALVALATPMYEALRKDNQKLEFAVRGSNQITKDPATRTGFEIRASVNRVGKPYGSLAQEYQFRVQGKEPSPNADGSYPIEHKFSYDPSDLITATFSGIYHSSGGTDALSLIDNATNGAIKKCEDLLTTYFGATIYFDLIAKEFSDPESTDNSIKFSLMFRERPFENETIAGTTDDYEILDLNFSKDISAQSGISGGQTTSYTYDGVFAVSKRYKSYTDFKTLYDDTIRPFVKGMLQNTDPDATGNISDFSDVPVYDIMNHKISISGSALFAGNNNYISYEKQISFKYLTNQEFMPIADGIPFSDYRFPPVEQLFLSVNLLFIKMYSEGDTNLIELAKDIKAPSWIPTGNGKWYLIEASPTYEKKFKNTRDGEIDIHIFQGSATFRWNAQPEEFG